MTTIEVNGISANSAPTTIQLATWHEDWTALTGLTAWAAHPTSSTTSFRCTTTSTFAQTEAVVEADLQAWLEMDLAHRGYSVEE